MAIPGITAAVIGLGRIGYTMGKDSRRAKPATHVEAYLFDQRVRLVAVADTDPVRREEFRADPATLGIPVFDDVDATLGAFQPSVVSVATPTDQHAEIVIQCAQAGVKVILCEKPLAGSVADGQRMIRACAEHDAVLIVNHSRRFDPMIGATIKLLREGHFGTVRTLVGHYTAGLFNNGTHLLDLMQAIVGVPTRLLALPSPTSGPKDDINADALLAFEGDAMGVIQAHEVLDYAIFTLEVFTASRLVVFDDFSYSIRAYAVGPSPWFDGYQQLLTEPEPPRRPMPRSFMGSAISYAIDVLAGTHPPISTGEEAVAVLRTLRDIWMDAHAR